MLSEHDPRNRHRAPNLAHPAPWARKNQILPHRAVGDLLAVPQSGRVRCSTSGRVADVLEPTRVVTVMVVEDDPDVAGLLAAVLGDQGYDVLVAGTGEEAIRVTGSTPLDLVILDLSLPDVDGLVLCAQLRKLSGAPIIICSARTEPRDRVLGLKLGADDYVSKPIDLDELTGRITAVMRRGGLRPARTAGHYASPPAGELTHVGPLTLDHRRLRVMSGAGWAALTPPEFQLLLALTRQPNVPIPWETLVEATWGGTRHTARTLQGHVHRLRDKLAELGMAAGYIRAVPGVGYCLVLPSARTRAGAA